MFLLSVQAGFLEEAAELGFERGVSKEHKEEKGITGRGEGTRRCGQQREVVNTGLSKQKTKKR